MADDEITFEEEFKIRATEIDFDQKATLPAICNLLQEVAGNHAQQLEFDITDLHEDKLTWVLHRLCVKMDRYPEWRETITIKTWPSSGDGIRAYRDFLILDSGGNTIGKCLSYWLMMNIESRRPTRIPKKILQMAPSNIDHVLPVTESDFQDIKEPDRTEHYNVRNTDLDLNRHVNNVRYIEWALSTLPEESAVSEIDIIFMAEATQEDSVIAEGQEGEQSPEGSNFYHEITRKADQKIVAKARSN